VTKEVPKVKSWHYFELSHWHIFSCLAKITELLVSVKTRKKKSTNVTRGMAMVDVNVVYDDIANKLKSDAASTHNVHISATSIDGFVAIENEFLRELNHHVGGEHDPQWLILYHCISKCSWFWVHRVLIRRISDYVKLPTFSTLCVLPKPNCTIS